MTTGTRVLGYARVSTEEQAESGLGLEAQEAAIRAECDRRGWTLVDVVRDEGASGKDLARPGVSSVLERIADGDADALVVAKLDRLSRSVVDFGRLLEWFTEHRAVLVALDLGVDTSTPGGRLIANVFASVAEWERDTIAQRTADAMAAKRVRGERIGRPAVHERPELRDRIHAMRTRGMTFQAIADDLNAEQVPTLRGAALWRPSSVQAATGYKRPTARRRSTELPQRKSKRKPNVKAIA